MKKPSKKHIIRLDGPLLDKISISFRPTTDFMQYPFSIPLIQQLKEIQFPTQVTFFVGENGTGKSTILEAIASNAGFGPEGGSRNIHFKTSQENTYQGTQHLAECLTLSWRHKSTNGYFFRAESFFNVANYIDYIAREGGSGPEVTYASYGGKSLHNQSHGESFLSFFQNRLGQDGLFIFDEPEAALSPQRQLSLLALIHTAIKTSNAQFIIATHSPLLLAFPNATIYSCDDQSIQQIAYTETHHYQVTKNFLDNPERYLYHLFND
ncbi:MAG TPA: AAA family ATPase [Candidatus Babeliales bacterium]|nr:AAA family ATPase [Candidatus Babeliales bacterium]